tara:strand:- start:401 stop:595 length:195 start_codon:yes stop_codon:yes gene_type:complete
LYLGFSVFAPDELGIGVLSKGAKVQMNGLKQRSDVFGGGVTSETVVEMGEPKFYNDVGFFEPLS